MSDQPRSTNSATPDAGALSRGRRRFLLTGLLGLIAGHAVTFVVPDHEIWPFSNYSLYTEARDADVAEQYVLVGVTAGPDSAELALYRHPDLLLPHYRATHHGTFGRLADSPDSLALAAEDCLRVYEARRLAHQHDGPPLVAMRVYLYEWHYANVDPVTREPTGRTLLAQATTVRSGTRP